MSKKNKRGRTTNEGQGCMERCSERGDGPTRPEISQKKMCLIYVFYTYIIIIIIVICVLYIKNVFNSKIVI